MLLFSMKTARSCWLLFCTVIVGSDCLLENNRNDDNRWINYDEEAENTRNFSSSRCKGNKLDQCLLSNICFRVSPRDQTTQADDEFYRPLVVEYYRRNRLFGRIFLFHNTLVIVLSAGTTFLTLICISEDRTLLDLT